VISCQRTSVRRSTSATIVVLAVFASLLIGSGSAHAATASITVSDNLIVHNDGMLSVTGTATCGIPSGTATVHVKATEFISTSSVKSRDDVITGTGSTTITCADRPVSWWVRIRSDSFWQWAAGFLTIANATLDQAGAPSVTGSTRGYPHY
jgi:hypothetical protein